MLIFCQYGLVGTPKGYAPFDHSKSINSTKGSKPRHQTVVCNGCVSILAITLTVVCILLSRCASAMDELTDKPTNRQTEFRLVWRPNVWSYHGVYSNMNFMNPRARTGFFSTHGDPRDVFFYEFYGPTGTHWTFVDPRGPTGCNLNMNFMGPRGPTGVFSTHGDPRDVF